jgi:hypothetical protein
VQARRALELGRNALLMQTSCGWFFDELTGLEPVQILRYAARVIELGEVLGRRLEDGFCDRLQGARSNRPGGDSGADVYRRAARGRAATPARVAASAALLAVLGEAPRVPGWDVTLSAAAAAGELEAEARVTEHATGAVSTARVVANREEDGAPVCRVGDRSFDLRALFGVQRENLLDALSRQSTAATRAGRRTALGRIRALTTPLLAADTPLPLELAMLLGYETAENIVSAIEAPAPPFAELSANAATLRRRGVVFPARWLARRIAFAIEERIAALPDGAPAGVALLDLAEAAGVVLDVSTAQVRALAWRRRAPAAMRAAPGVAELCARLRLAPEAEGRT